MSSNQQAVDVLGRVFGYQSFRGDQEAIIAAAVRGDDCLVLMPTGGGKSLCYQIPGLLRPGLGIVISPLIALMADQVAALKEVGVRAEFLNSSLPPTEQAAIEARVRAGELDLLYLAPERLVQERTLNLLREVTLALFAIDEAHCVSQWGHDFRPEYLNLAGVTSQFAGVPVMALTATADDPTRREIVERLALRDAHRFVASFDRPNITYRVSGRTGNAQLLRFIQREHPGDAGIVYCLSRASVERTAAFLAGKGIAALPYHAGLDRTERDGNQHRFLNEEGIVIVATIAFGMGIDKPNVRFVAHMDLPGSMEAYYQETGRAGRDGLAADAMMFYGLADVVKRKEMVAGSQAPEARKRVERIKLDALLGYCELASCRRQALLKYFSEDGHESCGNCDNCLSPPQTWDATEAARLALSAVYRTGQRFGVGYLVEVLHGEEGPRILGNGHQRLQVFGMGKGSPKPEWRNTYRQLISLGLLDVDDSGYGTLRLSESCRPVLRGDQQIHLRRVAPTKGKRQTREKHLLPPQAEALFESMRALRLEIAREAGVPPYVIFSDATLAELAQQRPQTLAQMMTINGIGETKRDRYGQQFLAVITGQCE